ncbi:hypothetical protein QAD02_023582 [Eretmocerus hayati]|uniref:Uncharacterized protein n=1 Tax=Eretmocerus hayati TaxID=131215 RepID=A0ACC2PWB6_9HYME|nr:hypothetical protein QAD02_023582 [Eretmocerus hayati]
MNNLRIANAMPGVLPVFGFNATLDAVNPSVNQCRLSRSILRFVAEVDHTGQLSKILVLNARAGNRNYRPDNCNCIPLMHVAAKNFNGVICDCKSLSRLMLAAGADISLMEYWGAKCLHPYERGDGMLDILLQTPVVTFVIRRRIYDDSLPMQAALRSSKISVKMLEAENISVQNCGECNETTKFQIAAKVTLQKKVNTPTSHNTSLLPINYQNQHIIFSTAKNTVSRPLKKIKNSERRRDPVLSMTLLYGTSEILPYVLDLMIKGVVRLRDEALLDLSLINADPSIMQYLLYEGICDVNQKDDYGYTALHKLIDPRMRYTNLLLKIQTLINSGADINAKTKTGQTVLSLATRRYDHYVEVIECLIKNIALLQKKGRKINCSIWIAIEKNPKFETFYNKCKTELKELESCYIENSVSLYSILVREKIAETVRSKRIMHRFTHVDWYSISLEKRFPIYYSMLKSNFFEMKSRVDLIENATGGLERVLMLNSNAFYDIFDRILGNLQYEDLASLYRVSRLWEYRSRENPLFQQARARDSISSQPSTLPERTLLCQNLGRFLFTT